VPVHLTDFSNDKYVVLKAMHAHQIPFGEDYVVPLSQEEISQIVDFSRPKVNQLMKELMEDGYIEPYHDKRGRYMLTPRGLTVVDVFETLIPPAKQVHN